jgi:hypothetical protein
MNNPAAQILDEEIRQLQELKRMAGNPRLLDLMRRIVQATDTDGRQPSANIREPIPAPSKPRPARKSDRSPNGLTQAVRERAALLGKAFTIPQMMQALEASGFEFVGQDHQAATSSAVKALAGKEILKLTRRGSGPNPHWYEYVGKNLTGGGGS